MKKTKKVEKAPARKTKAKTKKDLLVTVEKVRDLDQASGGFGCYPKTLTNVICNPTY